MKGQYDAFFLSRESPKLRDEVIKLRVTTAKAQLFARKADKH